MYILAVFDNVGPDGIWIPGLMSRLVETNPSVYNPPVYRTQTHQRKLDETNGLLTICAVKNLVTVDFARLVSVVLSFSITQPSIELV